MKFVVSSSELLSRLQSINRVISSKNTLPILDNFLFEINDNILTVTASDIETTMRTQITLDNVDGEGKIAIEAKRLTDILKEFPEQPLSGKKIAFLGWAFKKNTNDTRETPAMYVADTLMNDLANISVFDPKVSPNQIFTDINHVNGKSDEENQKQLSFVNDPYEACQNAHAVVILTEWDMFKTLDWKRIHDGMMKPAFVFDGRNLLDAEAMKKLGFVYSGIGK